MTGGFPPSFYVEQVKAGRNGKSASYYQTYDFDESRSWQLRKFQRNNLTKITTDLCNLLHEVDDKLSKLQ